MNFIRLETRIYTDINNGYRYLTNPSKIEKWTQKKPNKTEQEQFSWVVWHFEESDYIYTFNLMRCGVKTEYCTEIHLMITHPSGSIEETLQESVRAEATALLDALRFEFNKEWVITDRDLSASFFKGSKL